MFRRAEMILSVALLASFVVVESAYAAAKRPKQNSPIKLSGCVATGPEACLRLESSSGRSVVLLPDARLKPGHAYDVWGRYSNAPTVCVTDSTFKVMRVMEIRLHCPQP